MNAKTYASMTLTATAPWPHYVVDARSWEQIVEDLAAGAFTLSGLWADGTDIHMALLSAAGPDQKAELTIITLPAPERRYPSVARHHPPALRLERALMDLFGIEAEGCPDMRPWLDHGQWPTAFPFAPPASVPPVAAYEFLPTEGDGLHQIPVGPIHAGIIEPGHFRFTANGETVVRLEERLGYVHRGVEKRFDGVDLETGAKLISRVSGDSTVAYALAFAHAAEAALGLQPPPRAVKLRALMAELERIANHIGDIGAICNDAAFALLLAHCGILREEVLRLADAAFGHRLMMDCVVPGGVAADLGDAARKQIENWLAPAEKKFDRLIRVYDQTGSLKNRTDNTGYLSPELARLYGAGGVVGRASGRAFDARRHMPYAPYDALTFETAMLNTGDVNARIWTRAMEITQSFALIRQILQDLPHGDIRTPLPGPLPQGDREGLGLVEGFRGDILVWLRLKDGKIARCHPRDPSWFQWPLLEYAIKGNIVADFPLCNKSFNCSYAGHDG